MASITEHKSSTGETLFKVTVTRKKLGYRETKSFPTRKAAEAWGKKREAEVDASASNCQPITKQKHVGRTLADAITRYTTDSLQDMGKTKAQVLNTIKTEYEIAGMSCDMIRSTDIVEFAKKLHNRPNVNSGATVLNYLSHLQAVFSIANAAWGFELDPREFDAAMTVCKKLSLVKKSIKRERRPTLEELDLLLSHFQRIHTNRPNSNPMHKICLFAIFSTRRQEEILRITWADLDRENKRVLVRDMKNPGDKKGNNIWCNLPDPCLDIIDTMPKVAEQIFPFNKDAVSAAFTRACKSLEITDLTFHDLRHEGASYLFEQGLQIPDVAKVTGHRSWQSLQRYTHIISKSDKYANWKWIKEVTKPE